VCRGPQLLDVVISWPQCRDARSHCIFGRQLDRAGNAPPKSIAAVFSRRAGFRGFWLASKGWRRYRSFFRFGEVAIKKGTFHASLESTVRSFGGFSGTMSTPDDVGDTCCVWTETAVDFRIVRP